MNIKELSNLKSLIFFITILLPLTVWSDIYSSKMKFRHVLDGRDIALGAVLAVEQDSDGFMWFAGENGLYRFDGYKLNRYQVYDDKGEVSITLSNVTSLFVDSKKRLWIGSNSGIFFYDKILDKITRPPLHESLAEAPITDIGVAKIVELQDGRIATNSTTGIIIFDPKDGKGIHFSNNNSNLSPGTINTIYPGESQYLWVGTSSGLDKVDLNTREAKNYKPSPKAPDSQKDNSVWAIVADKNGALWLGTHNALIHYTPDTKKSIHYSHDPNDKHSFSGGDIWDIGKDSNGNVLLAIDGGGLNIFNPTSKKFIRVLNNPSDSGSLVSNVARTFTFDNAGGLWVGNYPGGVHYFDPASATTSTYLHEPTNPDSISYNSIMSVVEDKKGNLWIGTDGGGLNYFDRAQDTFKAFKSDASNPNTISANAVLSVFLDSQDVLWGGTWAGGVFNVDTKTMEITRLPHEPKIYQNQSIAESKSLNGSNIWCIFEDKNKFIWICTHTGGLNKYDQSSGVFTHYLQNDQDEHSTSSNLIWAVYEDSKERFWVAGTGGLTILDRSTGKFSNFGSDAADPTRLPNSNILTIFEDSQNRMWFGHDEGISLYLEDNNTFVSYGKNNDFFDTSIRGIVEDKSGKLWLTTNNGIVAFDPKTKKVKNHNRDLGKLIGGFNYNAAIMTSSGDAVFGGKEGLRVFRVNQMKENNIPPNVALTDFRIFAESIKIGGEEQILTQSINNTESITLDYTKTVLEFEFTALSYQNPNNNEFAYMLEGFDSDWVYSGNKREAKYTNLDAGTYFLRVKAANSDGVWNEEGRTLRIIQLPPPWETWWAYTLYALTILCLITWFIAAQRKKRRIVEEQNRILEEKVKERTAEITKKSVEIEQKNNDIQSMLSNIQQGLFTIEDNGKIHPEYSAFLEKIFETDRISGKDVNSLLFKNANIGSNQLNESQEAIFSILGEDEMNYDFNSHLLINKYDTVINDSPKHLSLDWNPIVVDDNVKKLMVTVRDITQLIQMEAENASKQRELDIIVQLLNITQKKYIGFIKSATEFVEENREVIKAHTEKDSEAIALLFRNMHTIKGNCRTFGFNHISNVAHEVENVYSDMKSPESTVTWDQKKLLSDLDTLEEVLAEYQHVYREVLGRSDSSSGSREDGLWVNGSKISDLQKQIHALADQAPNLDDSAPFKQLNTFFMQASSSPLEKVLEDIIDSLPSIATQLEKEEPTVSIDSNNTRIKNSAHEFINNVFAHILRNCVDHGIEAPDERTSAGKSPQGSIKVHCTVSEQKLKIHIADDGRGVNIDRLFDKGVENGHWSKGDSPTTSEIANLIFASGVSTKETVSDISGRGVGMDAVKQFISDKGGEIYLNLLAEKASDNPFIPFETIIELPSELFYVSSD